MYFPATMEPKIKIVTYGLGYPLGLGIPLFFLWMWFVKGIVPLGLAPAGILAIALAITYLYRPLGYLVEAQGIAVRRPIGMKRFAAETIAAVSGATDLFCQSSIGLWRSGGFYGVYGIFWNKKYGRFLMYVTDCRNIIELVLKNGQRIYLSPDAKQDFLDAVNKQIFS